jgi:hypothetical protein
MSPTTTSERERMVSRIKALLAQAESTNFEEEAETFMAKAYELMDKYRIAVAEVRQEEHRGLEIGSMRYPLSSHKYLRASLDLLGAVAQHYSVVVVIGHTGNSKNPRLVGDRYDLEATVQMFRSLIVQRDRFCLRERVPHGAHQTRFRNSFCYGYSNRIGERLEALRKAARSAASSAGDAMALAVYDRLPAVRDTLAGTVGTATLNAPTVSGQGLAAGEEAGNRADLGQDRIGNTGPAAIGRGGA